MLLFANAKFWVLDSRLWIRRPSISGWLGPEKILDSGAEAWNWGSGSTEIICWANELHKYDDGFQSSMDQMLLKLEAEILGAWSWSLNIVFQLYSPDQNQQHFNLWHQIRFNKTWYRSTPMQMENCQVFIPNNTPFLLLAILSCYFPESICL